MDIKAFIEEVNKECPENQGIFSEPYCIPVDIKEPVLYTRYETGGVTGGSYHEYSCNRDYSKDEPSNKWEVLDIAIRKLKPDNSFLYSDYKKILELVHDNTDTDIEYYGNYTHWRVEYILLSDLLTALDIFID